MNEASLQTEIVQVVVYSTGARVTRQGLLARNGAWPEMLRISGLPLCMEEGSLKARVVSGGASSGDAGLPVATGVRVALEVPESNAGLAPAENAELKDAERAVERLETKIKHLEQRLQRLVDMKWAERPRHRQSEPPPPAPVQARLDVLALLREKADALNEERFKTEQEVKEARKRVESLEEAAQMKSSALAARKDEMRKTALITLRPPEGAGPDAVHVELEYLVPGARWAPSYTLRFAEDFSRARLEMRASVFQRTGEDWKQTRLTLSTAQPMRWTELPELSSLRIGRRQAAPRKKGWRDAPVDAWELFKDYDKEMGSPQEQRQLLQAAENAREMDLSDKDIYRPAMAGAVFHGVVMAAAGGGPRPEDREETRGASATRLYQAPAPPPPPSPAPAPMAAPPPAARLVRMAAPSVSRARTSAHDAPTDKLERLEETDVSSVMFGTLDAMEDDGGPVYEPPVLRKEMLDYGRLHMPPPDHDDRGSLKPMTRMEDLLIYAHQKLSVTVHAELEQTVLLSYKTARTGNGDGPGFCAKTVEGFDYAYVAEHAATLPSDGQFHSIPVRSMDVPVKVHFVTVPRIAPEVYRFAEFVNPLADAPMLLGSADLWCGDEFLMNTHVRTVPPGGLVRMGMGAEQGLKTARNVRYDEEASGLLGGSLHLRHHISIELKNNLARAAEIEVRERLPVTREKEEEIKVETGKVSPPWEVLKDELGESGEPLKGGRAWTVKVEPGAAKVLEASYTIQISSKHELRGGNRREGA